MKRNIITNFFTFGMGEPSGEIRMAASERQAQTALILCPVSMVCSVWVVIFTIS